MNKIIKSEKYIVETEFGNGSRCFQVQFVTIRDKFFGFAEKRETVTDPIKFTSYDDAYQYAAIVEKPANFLTAFTNQMQCHIKSVDENSSAYRTYGLTRSTKEYDWEYDFNVYKIFPKNYDTYHQLENDAYTCAISVGVRNHTPIFVVPTICRKTRYYGRNGLPVPLRSCYIMYSKLIRYECTDSGEEKHYIPNGYIADFRDDIAREIESIHTKDVEALSSRNYDLKNYIIDPSYEKKIAEVRPKNQFGEEFLAGFNKKIEHLSDILCEHYRKVADDKNNERLKRLIVNTKITKVSDDSVPNNMHKLSQEDFLNSLDYNTARNNRTTLVVEEIQRCTKYIEFLKTLL